MLLIVVLPLLLSLPSKLDGMVRTVMVAGEAGEAVIVVQPFGIFSMSTLDVAHRTDIGADATLHAAVFLHVESLVGDEHVLEESTYHLGEKPRDRTLDQSVDSLLAIEHLFADDGKLLRSLFLLAYLSLLGVYIHEWQTHVRLWHNERVTG